MNHEQIAAYQNETARLRAEAATYTNRSKQLIESHDKAVAAALRVLRDGDHEVAADENRDIDHGTALVDNLPCVLCGRHEAHGNHRGIGHTHTPAETPRGRAHALLGRMGGDVALVVPEYVYETALMMVGLTSDARDIVYMDHAEALADDLDRTVAGDLTSTGAWVPVRELGHPAHPHLLRPTECTHCGRAIFVRYDAHGVFESASHYA